MQAAVRGFTGEDTPKGCLLATSAISCSAGASDMQKELARIRMGIETQLSEKIAVDTQAGATTG